MLAVGVGRPLRKTSVQQRQVGRNRQSQSLPVGLGGKLDVEACLFSLPGTKCLRLQAVHLNRPVERQRDFFDKISLPVVGATHHPKLRMLRTRVVQPAAAFLAPIGCIAIATRFNETEKIGV